MKYPLFLMVMSFNTSVGGANDPLTFSMFHSNVLDSKLWWGRVLCLLYMGKHSNVFVFWFLFFFSFSGTSYFLISARTYYKKNFTLLIIDTVNFSRGRMCCFFFTCSLCIFKACVWKERRDMRVQKKLLSETCWDWPYALCATRSVTKSHGFFNLYLIYQRYSCCL